MQRDEATLLDIANAARLVLVFVQASADPRAVAELQMLLE